MTDSSEKRQLASKERPLLDVIRDIRDMLGVIAPADFADPAGDKMRAAESAWCLADNVLFAATVAPAPETLSVEPFPDTLVRWMTSDTWRCRCTSTGNINIKLCNYCGGCGTHRPEKAPAQKASEPRVAYNSNGDAYLVEPKASDDLIRRPTGQCSWGCYYNDNGKLVRDSACTVHGASSQSEGEQS